MSKRNSLENKKLRREAREAHTPIKAHRVQKWVPVTNKYGKEELVSVLMPGSMFK